jgi:F-type H+-transporting ATPase subunit b
MLIDWFTVAAQAVNFLLLVWLLKRFLYKPILGAIEEREKRIASQLQDAEKKKEEALKEQIDFQHKNEDFERQRATLLLEVTNFGKTERAKLLEKARSDSEQLRVKLTKTTNDELESLNRKIGTLAREEVFSVARKTLADLADVSLEERITAIFVRRLHDMDDKQTAELRAGPGGSSQPMLLRSAFALATPQRTQIETVVKRLFGEGAGIEFETRPDLISGIELTANGQKIAWNIADYLKSLTNSVASLLQPKFDSPPASQKVLPHAA